MLVLLTTISWWWCAAAVELARLEALFVGLVDLV